MSQNNTYEATFILGETATPELGKSKSKQIAESIKKLGGEVTKEEHWGRRELAYPIKRNLHGYYVTLWFELPGTAVKTLEQQLLFDAEVIRSLVTTAYTTAQPGSLYPVAEEEKSTRRLRRGEKEETGSAEEELRRHSTAAPSKKEKATAKTDDDSLSEEDRLKQLDTSLDELLKDEETK